MKNKINGSGILKKRKSNKKFTLTEILIVCALLAFVMGITVGGYKIVMDKSKKTATLSMIKQLEVAMEAYKNIVGYYYPQKSPAGAFVIDPEATEFIKYLPNYGKWKTQKQITWKGELVDPYGVNFWYRCPGYHNRMGFDIESAGPDTYFGYTRLYTHGTSTEAQWKRDKDPMWEHPNEDDDDLANQQHSTKYVYFPDKQADNINNWDE